MYNLILENQLPFNIMKNLICLFILSLIIIPSLYSQGSTNRDETSSSAVDSTKVSELEQKMQELDKLYTILSELVDNNKQQLDNGIQSINTKLDQLSNLSKKSIGTVNTRVESVEKIVNISDQEKKTYLNRSVDRNKSVQENFFQFIKFYGDKYNQLDEKVTSEELALELRKIINPQTGAMGFTLSSKLNTIMHTRFHLLVDEIMKDGKKKNEAKKKIDNTINAVTSTLNNPIINDVVGIIPFGSSIKNIVGTVSGLIVNMFNKKDVKDELKERVLEKMKNHQDAILGDLKDIITFYDKMAKLDNQYEISLQNIRNDVVILGIELKEFCIGLETPLKKVDPSFSIDKNKSIREITIQISNKFDALRNDTEINKSNLDILTNISSEVKNRSRDLYNRYREVQESKIIANNKFVENFAQIVENSNLTKSPGDVSNKLKEKNAELISKMNASHTIDKSEFERYLDKIWELN